VEYARTDRLHVKRNDDLTWDYTEEFARGGDSGMGGGMRGDRPVLLNEPPKMAANSLMGGGMGMGGGVIGGGGMGGGNLAGMMGMGGMGNMGGMSMGGMGGGMNVGMGGGGMGGGIGGGMGAGMGGGGGMMGGMSGGMGGGLMNRLGGGDSYGGMGGGYGGVASVGGGGMGGGGSYGGRSSVCMMYGAEPDKFNCQRVFNLLCQYGNVRKVMFMKNKEGCVMVEMADPESVQRVIENLSNTAIFGLKLRMDWSKKETINEIRKPFELPDGTESYASFERDRNNRFDTPEKAAKNRIIAPTKTLHFYNVPKMEDADMEAVFAGKEAPVPARIKWFPSASEKSASGLAEFDSVQEAAEALVLCNHCQIDGHNAKFPYTMKLCFSQGPREGGGRGDHRR
jgi:heterogeneous nuclear ribonucleoprotein L